MERLRKKVAINGRFTGTPQPTGTQTAAFHLFDQIVRANRDFELVIFGDSRFMSVAEWARLPGVRWVETPFLDWSRMKAQAWEQLALPLLARRHGCRLTHHPITTSPMWHAGGRSLVTLHDLNFYLHPEWVSKAFRRAYLIAAVPGLKRADCVVTISDYIRRQAHEVLGIPEDRLRMIYNGVKPLQPEGRGLGHPGRYVLCVGAMAPHKNLPRMIEAYLAVRDGFPGIEFHIVGRPQGHHHADERVRRLLSAPGVRLLGYLSEADLARAYAGAEVYCYPSLEEGFGLPLLEAMSVGTPVLASNVSCIPEIAADAAILVDPLSVESLAEGLRAALRLGPAEREALAAKGRARAAEFTWRAAAEQYLALYGEMA